MAYWLRRQDDRLGADPVGVEAETEIHRDDVGLNYVLSLYGAVALPAGPLGGLGQGSRKRMNRPPHRAQPKGEPEGPTLV
jgi:hypothetical protein